MTISLKGIEERIRECPAGSGFPIPAGFVPSAVLIPIFEKGGVIHLLFTERTGMVNFHKGEISFPGGVKEGEEDYPVGTALRESREEIGVQGEDIRVLGILPGITTITDFLIHPVAGILERGEELRINRAEVRRVLSIPVERFSVTGVYSCREFERGGEKFMVPFFTLPEGVIWGATGRILREFLRIVIPEINI